MWEPGVEEGVTMGQVLRVESFTPRIADRADVCIETQISVANRARAITLINLSRHGFMGECRAGVPLRSRISIELPGIGAFSGCVHWAVGRRVGGRFDTPLDEIQLAGALETDFS